MTDNVESGDIKIHYCLINFILASRSFYCLWFDDGKKDRFLTDTTNTLLYFENENEIRNFCTAHNLNIQKNKAVCYNIHSFIHEFNLYDIDCSIFLDYWNIASDMAYQKKNLPNLDLGMKFILTGHILAMKIFLHIWSRNCAMR